MYRAPVDDLRFTLEYVLDAGQLTRLPLYREFSMQLAEAVLAEADHFASGVLEPVNQQGDRVGATWTAEGVQAAPGFGEAYRQYVAGGWPQLGIDAEQGGQGAPFALVSAVEEIWYGANMALMLCPMLSRGAIEALQLVGSAELKKIYLPNMIAGTWSGTMVLTEAQAGSDLGAIRTRAAPSAEHYLISGQKIFISYGDHGMTENIVHLVLARIEGAPPGVKGLSLFLVPKFIPGADGKPGQRNEVHCVSIEHKLGIHASPTCVLAFGGEAGAVGYLVGEANRGLECMFIMMNAARLSVGIQGIGLAERALQQASAWARGRVQGRPAGSQGSAPVPITYHPDVRRSLMTMRSGVEAMRALALYAALQLDLARAASKPEERSAALLRGELLIPIVKGWSTEYGTELVSLGLQVHGGMGYIEETGIAQTLRDVRITTIYEGTTAIQANDLLGRKLGRDGGAAMLALLSAAELELKEQESELDAAGALAVLAGAREGIAELRSATASLLASLGAAPAAAYAVSVPYLRLCGITLGGWLLARAARIAVRQIGKATDQLYWHSKLQSANHYAAQTLPLALALSRTVRTGGAGVAAADVDLL
ncbi:MAG TPA: acyl-CoA dehydrogenase [Steroidobacteraceae bacterium]|nr:acyl-CoA dehydrogenase [Steroidobacteraceae bacterium]